MKKRIAQTLFILLVTNASFAQFPIKALEPELISFRPKTAEGGIIMGSITFPKEKAKYYAYFFHLGAISDDRKTARKNSTEFSIKNDIFINGKHSGEIDKGLTYLIVIERPAGSYVINNVRLSAGGGALDNLGGFRIPIEVKKGEITYIGNIQFNEYAANGEPILDIQDNYARDVKVMKLFQPYVLWSMATNDSDTKVEYVPQ